MDRWKAEMGRVREEKRRRKKIKKEKLSEERRSRCAKRRKSRNTVFFQWFVAPEGRKSGGCGASSPDERWKIACRCGAKTHFNVKMYKTHQVRTTFGCWDVEKLHAVVARNTFRCQNVQTTPGSDNFWMLRCRKSARGRGAKHISKSKCTEHTSFGPLLEVAMSKKCTPLWRETHFDLKMLNTPHAQITFWRSDVFFPWQAQGIMHLVKSEQNVWVLSHFQKWWQAWDIGRASAKIHFRGRRSTRDMFIRDVRRSGRWFPERGYILEHQIFSFGKMILRDRCSTSYDLASLFRGRRSTLDRWSANIAKRIGTRPSALHSTFHFWRKSRSIVSFLMLSTSKIEEVSQNCLFRFWCCQVQNWGSLAKKLRFQACR